MSSPVPTIHQLLQIGHQKLKQQGSSSDDADILLAHTLDVEKEYLYTHPEQKSTTRDWEVYSKLLEKRAAGYSVAVLVGYKYFYGLRFAVTEDTLVPRPESEVLVDEAVRILQTKKTATILDMGTGCGNLVITINHEIKKTRKQGFTFYAADISTKALDVARANARAHHVPVLFFQSNLFSNIAQLRFDLILANLPYLTTEQLREPSIRKEPIGALWAGTDGLDMYRVLLDEVEPFRNPNSVILLEIDPQQSDAIEGIVREHLPTSVVSLLPDLAGHSRVVKIAYRAMRPLG